MNFEQTLTDELRAVADDTQAPPPPAAADLARAAGRSRTRSRLTRVATSALVAAAVVAAVVLAGQVGRSTSAPQPTGPTATPTEGVLATGAPPRLRAYVVGSTLFLDGTRQPGQWSGTTGAGDSAAASPKSRAATREVVLFRDGRLVARLEDTDGVVFSPDGTRAAWFQVAPDFSRAFLIERDMVAGQEAGRLAVDATLFDENKNEEAWESVVHVGDDGTVYYGGLLVSHRWKPGAAPVDLPARAVKDAVSGFPRDADAVELSPDGTRGAWLTGRNGRPMPAGADPTAWRYDGITVQQKDHPDTRFTIELPISANARGVLWESPTDLLVTVFDDPSGISTHFLRCSTPDRHCELAPTPAATP